MNGLREFARRRGSVVSYLPLDEELRLADAEGHLRTAIAGRDPRGFAALPGEALCAFPAQSNFSGVKHPLDLIHEAKSLGYNVLVDAAAFLPANRLRLSAYPADFVVFSAYKILGYPTGVGALVGRKASMARLERPWFAGVSQHRGGAIAFNVLEPDGTAIPFASVVDRARECGVSLRGGCFCNPGAAEAAFGFPYAATAKCLRTAATDGFSIDKFSQCLGPGIPVGAVRASLGVPSNKRDIDRAIEVVESLSTGD